MGTQGAYPLARLVMTVPRVIAEPFGAALVELGAGAVEERPTRHADTVEIVLTRPAEDPLLPWQNAARCLYQVFAEDLHVDLAAFTMRTEAYDPNYHDAWLKHLTLVQLTPDLVFAPLEDPTPTPKGQRRLRFTPHVSFGDGSHVTTRLAATAIETYCKAHPGCRLLDVGTGNGVLSLVAAACGAFAFGIDLDSTAVQAAEANAQTNDLTERCRFSTAALETVTEQFDLVVANVEPLTQLELSQALIARVAPGKTLLLTGFLVEQAATLQEPFLAAGFTLEVNQSEGDFVLLRLAAPHRVSVEAP